MLCHSWLSFKWSLCSLRTFAHASPLCRTFPEQPPSFSMTASLRHCQVTFPGPVWQHGLSLPQVTPKPICRERKNMGRWSHYQADFQPGPVVVLEQDGLLCPSWHTQGPELG
ncbi:rCG32190 [Rattus norvegicus]|uniref:RCG32190 n=1 Tax=Rattus norvegicus TaxID=10116 RepID=A6JXL9_RAT|nr:rCG32190 [Rattus norvegicus]